MRTATQPSPKALKFTAHTARPAKTTRTGEHHGFRMRPLRGSSFSTQQTHTFCNQNSTLGYSRQTTRVQASAARHKRPADEQKPYSGWVDTQALHAGCLELSISRVTSRVSKHTRSWRVQLLTPASQNACRDVSGRRRETGQAVVNDVVRDSCPMRDCAGQYETGE